MKRHTLRKIFVLVISFVFLSAWAVGSARAQDSSDSAWNAPASAQKQKNPVPMNAKSIAAGQVIYQQQCFACHGMTGKGDGPASMGLKPAPADLTSPKVQKETDGSLFWKISQGHTPMPMFSQILTKQQRWDIVNYVRSLSKTTKK